VYSHCIFGPTKDRHGTWRIKTNYELNNLIRNKNIINYIKAQRFSWFGKVHGMTNDRMVTQFYEWKRTCTRLAGRSKIRWENHVK
jgi:hypothetical protein